MVVIIDTLTFLSLLDHKYSEVQIVQIEWLFASLNSFHSYRFNSHRVLR